MDKFMKKINNNGFSLMEILVVTLIMSMILGGVYMSLATGKDVWMTTNGQIVLQENLRSIMEKVSSELRESGSNGLGVMQVTLNDGAGLNNSDTIRFSIPVICETGGTIMDVNGDVANWGAPFTWGCSDSTCMDADDDCLTVDYQFIQYQIDANNRLLRLVMNPALATVNTTIFGENIIDVQATLSGDQNVLTITLSAQRTTEGNRVMTMTSTFDVFLRNRG